MLKLLWPALQYDIPEDSVPQVAFLQQSGDHPGVNRIAPSSIKLLTLAWLLEWNTWIAPQMDWIAFKITHPCLLTCPVPPASATWDEKADLHCRAVAAGMLRLTMEIIQVT